MGQLLVLIRWLNKQLIDKKKKDNFLMLYDVNCHQRDDQLLRTPLRRPIAQVKSVSGPKLAVKFLFPRY